MRTLITILDGITETSMPFNEFVLFRAKHYQEERQVLIVCGAKKPLPKVKLPESLRILYVGKNVVRLRRTIQKEVQRCRAEGEEYVIHMHQVKSAVLGSVALLGMPIRRKTLFTVHSTFSGYALHNKLESLFSAACSRYVTCVSHTSYQNYPRVIRLIKGNRMCAIQNGVDTERIDNCLSGEGDRGAEGVSFVYVARMIPIKNHLFLVKLLSKCEKNVKFIFIGALDKTGGVQRAIEENHLQERIAQTDLIPRNEVFAQLQSADVYLSSSTLEGLPVSVLEAMYVGLPAILSNIPQHTEIAGEGKTFLSLLPLKEEVWVEEINRYAQMPRTEREKRGAEARKYVKENFSLSAMHRKYDEIYHIISES